MIRRSLLLFLLAVLLLSPAPVGSAGDDEARFRAELRQCRLAVKTRKWSTASKRYEKLLVDHEGRDYVRREVASIEDDLKVILFMRADEPPRTRDLLGEGVKEYRDSGRRITLEYSKLGPPDWRPLGEKLRALDHVFDGDVRVEVESRNLEFDLYLCLDPSAGTGYVVHLDDDNFDSEIRRLDGRRWERLVNGIFRYGEARTIRVERRKSLIRIYQNRELMRLDSPGRSHGNTSISDGTYRSGRIATNRTSVKRMEIKGTLDKGWVTQLVGEAESRRFEAWVKGTYDRAVVLPPWLRSESSALPAGTVALLPSDAPRLRSAALERAVRTLLDGNGEKFLKEFAKRHETLPPVTAAWLAALAAGERGEIRRAHELASVVLEKSPQFGPAYALRGLACLHLRKEVELALDLARARELAPRFPYTIVLAAQAALLDRDVAAADRVLSAAIVAGVKTPLITTMARQIHRSHRGPNWRRKHRHETSHFVVVSDHSARVCRDVAIRLEQATNVYARRFPRRKTRLEKARVRVFSNRDDYRAYGRDVGALLEGSAGAYIPQIRELVLFYVPGSDRLDTVVRHEGFHWYIHELVDDLPIWFNEGHAVCYETAARPDGPPTPDAVNTVRMDELIAFKAHARARDLMLMDPRTFMANARVHYPVAWLLVRMLRTTKHPALKGRLDDYFQAIRDGASQRSAYEQVFAPVLAELHRVEMEHLRGVLGLGR